MRGPLGPFKHKQGIHLWMGKHFAIVVRLKSQVGGVGEGEHTLASISLLSQTWMCSSFPARCLRPWQKRPDTDLLACVNTPKPFQHGEKSEDESSDANDLAAENTFKKKELLG